MSQPSLTPDDDVFKHLSLTYANNHGKMSRGVACKTASPSFENGITNGAAWYPLTGGMQDFNYVWHGCMEVTLEVSCCKFPPAYELRKYWDDNQLSLIKFLAEAHRGVQGFVVDPTGNPVERAQLKIKGRDIGFTTTKYGEFWRVLLPGVYKLEVYADGYVPKDVDFMVVEQHPTLLNVTLQPSKKVRRNGNDYPVYAEYFQQDAALFWPWGAGVVAVVRFEHGLCSNAAACSPIGVRPSRGSEGERCRGAHVRAKQQRGARLFAGSRRREWPVRIR